MSEGKKFLIAAALMLIGCGGAKDPSLHPQQELYEPLQEAVARWNPKIAQCGRSLSITADDGDFVVRYGTPFRGGDAMANTHVDPVTGGGEVIVSELASDPAHDSDGLVKTLTHELGHVLGADDSDNPNDLMYWSENGVMDPTDNDVAAVCAH